MKGKKKEMRDEELKKGANSDFSKKIKKIFSDAELIKIEQDK